jgi:hypothetical protein
MRQIILSPKDVQRFWSKVDRSGGPDACWIWTATPDTCGYGRLNVAGNWIGAHRLSWTINRGAIPDGLFVCHDCPDGDNPACVNPSHLFLGTVHENNADRDTKGRLFGKDRSGERNGRARLTRHDVEIIRSRRVERGVTRGELAMEFGVSPRTIGDVLNGKTWSQ